MYLIIYILHDFVIVFLKNPQKHDFFPTDSVIYHRLSLVCLKKTLLHSAVIIKQ